MPHENEKYTDMKVLNEENIIINNTLGLSYEYIICRYHYLLIFE